MLEMFVFLSGYLFAYQIFHLHKKFTLKGLLKSKFKRLIIPSIVFSLFYSILFYSKPFNVWNFIYDILNGMGHMWFLPMLFWCFVFSYFIIKIKLNEKVKLILILGISILSVFQLPFRLNSACYYLFFFYLGSYILNNKGKIMDKIANDKSLLTGLIIFILLFVSVTLLREQFESIYSSIVYYKAIQFSILTFSRILLAITGLFLFYVFVNYLIEIKHFILPKWMIDLNPICFGVYLFQQFILMLLYYKTSFPSIFGTYWLPIIGLIITVITSVVLTKLTLKTKIGRLLIG